MGQMKMFEKQFEDGEERLLCDLELIAYCKKSGIGKKVILVKYNGESHLFSVKMFSHLHAFIAMTFMMEKQTEKIAICGGGRLEADSSVFIYGKSGSFDLMNTNELKNLFVRIGVNARIDIDYNDSNYKEFTFEFIKREIEVEDK